MKKLFTLFAAALMAMSTMAAGLNIYASGLKAHGMKADKTVKVDYVLNDTATALEIHLLNADNTVALNVPITDEAMLTPGQHVATLNVSTLAVGDYAWEVKATAAPKTELTKVSDDSEKFIFYATRGVVVNNYPETDDFGTVYVSMNANGANDGGTQTSKTQQIGIFVYDALLNLKNTGNAGYTCGIPMGTGVPYRLQVAEDGNLFISGNNADNHGIWMVDGKLQNDAVKVLTKTGLVYGFDVDGTYPNYTFYNLEDIAYNNACIGSFKKYAIDAIPFANEGDSIASASDILQGNANDNVATDGHGGWFLGQYRGSDSDGLSVISHVNKDGVKDWNSSTANLGLAATNRGAMAMNKDKTILGVANSKKATVFSVAWDEAGLPELTKLYETPELGNMIDGIAFDYANNLYVVSSTTELLYVFAPEKAENTETTPAAKTQIIKVLDKVVDVTSVTLDKTEAEMWVGDQMSLVATVNPADATDKSVVWTSSDATIATVDANGLVSGLKAGTVTITVAADEGTKTASCAITVKHVAVESISVDPAELTLYSGESKMIAVTITPSNATNKNVTWTSSDETVATVDAEGKITALKPGTATMTVTTEDLGKTATVELTVPEGAYPNIYAYGLKLESTDNGVVVGFNLNAPAKKVSVYAYDAEGTAAIVGEAENLKPEYQTLTLDVSFLSAGTYTWSVEAEADLIAEDEPVQVRQYAARQFTRSRGMAIDQNTNSPYFGNLYVAEENKGVVSDTRGLYIYSPKLEGGNLYMKEGWSAEAGAPMRVVVGHDDNLVYVSDFSDGTTNVHYLDPANPDDDKVIFGGVNAGGGVYKTEDGTFIHGSMAGIYVKGTGTDRKLFTMDEDAPAMNTVYRYNIGEMTTLWEKKPSKEVYNQPLTLIQNTNVTITLDKNDNMWLGQYRYTDGQGDLNSLVHLSKTDEGYEPDFLSKGILGGPNFAALAFDRDQTMCVSASGSVVRVFDINWDENGAPSLTLVAPQAISTGFGEIHALAIDHAKNVYVAGVDRSLQVWALIKEENKEVTPAPQTETFTIVADGVENINNTTVGKKGVYSVTGQYLGEKMTNDMPKGVYIVNGEKVVR